MRHKMLGALLSLTALGAGPGHALGRLADIELIDRDTGAVLSPTYYRGEYWVAGTPGARYAIRIHNRQGERLLAVASVDGVNVISGATAGTDQDGYVFGSYESYDIDGWRKSDTQVADFIFTDPQSAYATRTGRPANLGVIGIALFREQPATLGEITRTPLPPRAEDAARAAANAEPSAPAAKTSGDVAAPPRPATAPPAALAREAPAPFTAPQLGTGHGQREFAPVERTEFVRRRSEPNELIRIRYDRLEHLIALGIVRAPRPLLAHPDP